MDTALTLLWIKENLLAIIAVAITIVFVYSYIVEREHGIKLSRKYRDSLFEAQSQMLLNATTYILAGKKDLAIKEFLTAVDLNKDTIETYFTLGKLFRSNGQIDKAISIHRSVIARDSINESTRLAALKELAIDFDKGGFVDKAIDTYKDVLKINRDQYDVVLALCRIFEDTGDWDQAYKYRIMLSKLSHDNQAQTISHILVEKAKIAFDKGSYKEANEDLEDAFRFSPSVSAKILKLKLLMVQKVSSEYKELLQELIKEHPVFSTFIFSSLDSVKHHHPDADNYFESLKDLKSYFLTMNDKEINIDPSVVLTKVRLMKEESKPMEAYELLKSWSTDHNYSEVLQGELIRLLIDIDKKDEAVLQTKNYFKKVDSSFTRHYCSQCGFNADEIFWRCPQCHEWETIQFRWKV